MNLEANALAALQGSNGREARECVGRVFRHLGKGGWWLRPGGEPWRWREGGGRQQYSEGEAERMWCPVGVGERGGGGGRKPPGFMAPSPERDSAQFQRIPA